MYTYSCSRVVQMLHCVSLHAVRQQQSRCMGQPLLCVHAECIHECRHIVPDPHAPGPAPLLYQKHVPHPSLTWSMCPSLSGAACVPAVTDTAPADTAQDLFQRVTHAVSTGGPCNPLNPFPPLTANLCPLSAGLHGRRPPSRIPTRHGIPLRSHIRTQHEPRPQELTRPLPHPSRGHSKHRCSPSSTHS